MAKRTRVVTSNIPVIPSTGNSKMPKLTDNEIKARRYATSTTMGGMSFNNNFSNFSSRMADTVDSQSAQFYSPQLSTDFLEKPQNVRERRAFYRFFYNSNEIVGRAVDIHSTLPLSKLRLVPPKGKNKHQNEYVFKFFQDMCDEMKLFKVLLETAHEFHLIGNCLSKDAEVRTIKGYKKAQDIIEGDLVLTDKGRFRRVLKAFYRPSEDILRIKCWKDFRELPVTDEHPIEIVRDGKFIFEKAGNLSLSDYIRVTYPTEVLDRDYIAFQYPEHYKKVEGGYEYFFDIVHHKKESSYEAKKRVIDWLVSLQEPVIKTRKQIAQDLNVPLSTFHGIISTLDQESDMKIHERLGASGFQKGSQVKWYPIKDIKVDTSYDIKMRRFLKAVDGINIDNDFAYLAGFWVGDGTLSRDASRVTWGRGLWQIGAKETCHENLDKIRNILIKFFGEDAITEWTSEGMTYLKVISNPGFIEWWSKNFGETTFGKNNKTVPEWFIDLPQEKLQHFLAGLIDSDGCISVSGEKKHTVVVVAMCSRKIMDPIRDICLKCGIVVNYTEGAERDVILPQGGSDRSEKIYSITASDEESCYSFAEYSIKKIPEGAHFASMQRYYIKDDKGLAFKVRSIDTETYEDMVYNFEVEEDHTYQVAGFSTHNCFIFAEESEWQEEYDPQEYAKKQSEAEQKKEYLKQKFDITDNDPLYKGWKKLLILPPDQVRVRKLPLTDDVAIEYLPDPETRKFLTSDIPIDPTSPTKKVKNYVSKELQEKIRMSGVIPLDTDPYTGSHVHHLARKKSQYEPLGVSVIERCINTLVLMDKLRQAQTSIASRHMTPMRVVWSDGLNPTDVDNLREQVDMALVDPDFSIIANYEIHWEEMGSSGRLLDITGESEDSMNKLFAGLGVTREILTGEGTYSGSKISLEIMNTEYLLFREIMQDYVENYLFKPVAKKKGFIEYDEYGNEVLLYPRLSFTRLAIRDNEQFFDAAFQLYQKGSISIDLILDILNIDPESTKLKIEKDLFTVNDSLFNEVMRNIYTNVAAPLVEKTDLVQKMAEYLKLEMTAEETPPAEGASRFSSENKMTAEQRVKLAKILKYFQDNPQAMDKMISGAK